MYFLKHLKIRGFAVYIIPFFIASILLFSYPRPTEAAGGVVWDPGNNIPNVASAFADSSFAVKELALDTVAWQLANMAIKRIASQTVNWINSGFQGNPAYVTDPGQFFLDLGDNVASKYLSETSLNNLCAPFKAEVRLALVKNYLSDTGQTYSCSLSTLKNNYDQFMQDFSVGGWDGWFELIESSQNNPYGSYLDTKNQLTIQIGSDQAKYSEQLSWGRGILSYETCPEGQTVTQQQIDDGLAMGDPNYIGWNAGDCWVKKQTVTPGSVIEGQLNENLSSGLKRLEVADEINEIIMALLNQLIGRVVGGIGNGLRGASQGPNPYTSQLTSETEQGNYDTSKYLSCTQQPDTVDANGNVIPGQLDCDMNQQPPTPAPNIPAPGEGYCMPDGRGGYRCTVVPPGTTPVPGPIPPGGQCSYTPGNGAPNMFSIVQQVASERPGDLANSCQQSGGSSAFIDEVVRRLHASDPRFGWNGKRGDVNDLSQDAVSYFYGPGTSVSTGDTRVYVIDIISSVCPSGNAGASWTDVTQATIQAGTTGAYVYPGGSVAVADINDPGPSCVGGGTTGGGGSCMPGGMGNDAGAPSTINESQIVWGDADISGWPVTASLSVSVSGNSINLNYDRANTWPNVYYQMFAPDPVVGNAWVVAWRNGAWHASTFEWLRPGQTSKGLDNLIGADGTLVSPLGNFSPRVGELYGFVVSTPARGGNRGPINERSNVALLVWPGPVCTSTGTTPGGTPPPGGTTGGAPVVSSISPSSATSGLTTVTLSGTNLTTTVQFFGSNGQRSTVVGTLNSTATQVSVMVPAGIPIGYATVRVYRDANTVSNGVLLNITATSGGTTLPSTQPTSTWRPSQTINGWWPRISPNGRYVAYGDFPESWVTDLQTGVNYDFSTPADLVGITHMCIGGQWITPTRLTFVCESNDLPRDNMYRYEVDFSGPTPGLPVRTTENTSIIAGNEFVARDGHWASFIANASMRLAKDNQIVATGVGGATDISGSQVVHACDNTNAMICLRTGTTLTRTFGTLAPLNQMTMTAGYIVYGGYGPVRGITPLGNDVNLRLSPNFNEGGGRSQGIRTGSAAQIVLVNGTYWVATVAWDPIGGGAYIFLRPWGSNTAIVLNAPAVSLDVQVVGTNFIIGYNNDRGGMAVITVPINSPRILIP